MIQTNEKQSGYTITELLVVLTILGLIAAAISPQVIGRLDSSKVRAARLQLETISASFDSFFIDVGRYPTAEEGVDALLIEPANAPGWAGPYVRSIRNITDPWGEKYLYQITNDGRTRILTLGSDKSEGGENSAADIQIPE
ncbi:MAG: type II secretion system major pseudopilin GspG [Pseudomonadota bacterium]